MQALLVTPHSVRVLQAPPSGTTGAHTPQSEFDGMTQAPPLHWLGFLQSSPSASVPTGAHAGRVLVSLSSVITSRQFAQSEAAVHSSIFSAVQLVPDKNRSRIQRPVSTSMQCGAS